MTIIVSDGAKEARLAEKENYNMINGMKKYVFTVLVTLALFCFAAVCINYSNTYADENVTETEGTFAMADGAEIRNSEPYGLRFITRIGDDFNNALSTKYADCTIKYGTILTTENKIWDVTAKKIVDIEGANYSEYRTVLTDIPTDELSTMVTAKSYVKVLDADNGLVFSKETESVSRSAIQVASLALADGKTDDILYTYVNGVDITLGNARDFRYEKSTDTLNLTPSTMPANCKVEWAVNKTEIATIDENGVLTPVKTGTVEVTAKLGNKTSRCDVRVIKVIKTKEEILNLFNYLTIDITKDSRFITMDGYIAIGADLDFSSKSQSEYNAVRGVSISGNPATTEKGRGFGFASYLDESVITTEQLKKFESVTNYGGFNGFIGTIDGQGHSIKGLQIASWGIFPAVGINGTIKNLAFTDTSLGAVYSYVLSGNNFYGTLDNCLIDVKTVQAGEQIRMFRLFGGTLKNSIVNIPVLGAGNNATSAAIGYKSTQNNYTITNAYVIGTENVVAIRKTKGDTSIVTNEYYTSIEKFNEAEKDYQGFNAEIWDFIGYEIPVFKTYNGTNITKKA